MLPRLGFAALFLTTLPLALQAQNFDNSGDGNLSGAYFFRYLVHAAAATSGAIGEGCSVTGAITFDGAGNYALSNTQSYDSAGSSGMCAAPANGTYGLQPNGLLQLDNLIFASTTIFGTYSQPVITGSSTEGGYYDLFVAIQASPSSVGNNALSGTFSVGSMEFLNAQSSLARDSWFTLSADGNGNGGTLTVNGSAVNLGSSALVQTIPGTAYSISGNGSGSLSIPLASGATTQSQLISGLKQLFVSGDGNYILAGSTNGLDMVFGIRSSGRGNSNALLNGTYFISGFEADLSSNPSFPDSFYGALNTGGNGSAIWHQRLNDIVDSVTYDNSFSSVFSVNAAGVSNDGSFTTLVGLNGLAFISVGNGAQYGLDIAVQAPSYSPTSGVWINPLGVVNAANDTPITNSYAPGELVSIFGTFGVQAQVNQSIPIPASLGGVQVLVNGTAAPISSVGPNQINALIPYGVGNTFATFQVVANGSTSNAVTVYVSASAPGIYTIGQNGIGPAAVLHADFTPVNASRPAIAGETVLLFVNGLGAVTPAVSDGAAGPANPTSNITGGASVFLDDTVDKLAQAAVSYAGLAPGFPGLYQVNFTIPSSGLQSGAAFIDLQTNEAATEMATINLTGFGSANIKTQSALRPRASISRRHFDHGARAQGIRQFVPHSHR